MQIATRNAHALVAVLALIASTIAFAANPASAQDDPPVVPEPIADPVVEPEPEPVPVQVAAGFTHSCALFDTGSVACWGDNSSRQLGDGSNIKRETPVGVLGLNDVIELDAGLSHTCALTNSGDVYCWGKNDAGQLGNPTPVDNGIPTKVAGVTGAVGIATGYFHTCAIVASGTAVKCWGAGAFGALGNGAQDNSSQAVTVASFGTARAIFAGYQSTCAVLSINDLAVCWGETTYDTVTAGEKFSTTPKTLADSTGSAVFATEISLGFNHGCAVNEGLSCWGHNDKGQAAAVPQPSNFNWSTAPTTLSGIATPTTVSLGANTSCFVGEAPTQLSCFGLDTVTFAESGFATQPSLADRPESEAGIRSWFTEAPITDLDSGFYHTCFIVSAEISCVGANYVGQMNGSAGTPVGSIDPVAVSFGDLMNFATSVDEFTRADEFTPDHANLMRLYQASFNRDPDLSGANYWVAIWNSGATLEEISYQFAFSEEFENRYGSALTNEEFLTVVYTNVLGRDFDESGFNYWLDLLETNQLGRAGVVQWISLGDEFVAANPYPAPEQPAN